MTYKIVARGDRRTFWLCANSSGGYAWRSEPTGAEAAAVFANKRAAQSALDSLVVKGAALVQGTIVRCLT